MKTQKVSKQYLYVFKHINEKRYGLVQNKTYILVLSNKHDSLPLKFVEIESKQKCSTHTVLNSRILTLIPVAYVG